MKKGFTLIELLAVIVILAVLAIIATPIVLNIIDDSKKNATLRSSENYIKAIEFSIAKSVMENKRLSDGTYQVMTNGSICLGTLTGTTCTDTLVVEVAGETPESGTITIKSRKIDSYEFTYKSGFVVVNGSISNDDSICTLLEGPAKEIGSKYECEVKPGTKFNFYVLSKENDETTNLIMDRNICEDGNPVTSSQNCIYEYNINGSQSDLTPKTVIEKMTLATDSWDNISNLNISFENFKITSKARPPYSNEVFSYDSKENNGYLYDNLEYYWNGCYDANMESVPCDSSDDIYVSIGGDSTITNMDGVDGYWLLGSGYDEDLVYGAYGTQVSYNGSIDTISIKDATGIRPVINVKL